MIPEPATQHRMLDYPRGTVTFVFTDIEGSTRLWQDHADEMSSAYIRHDAIFEAAILAHRGVRFKTIGDAFQIAFPTASAAVAAACEVQRALTIEQWTLPTPLRVRMAIHTGAVDPDATGDYRSPVLNRLGRLLGAGYGGQIILSQSTMELCRDSLPRDTALLDLGSQRLKDLFRPEQVYQLTGEDLPREFPPLKTIDRKPNNLPVQPTPFVGRDSDVAAMCEIMRRPTVRLLTATGTGGIGKTRLCLQAAAELLDDFDDGIFVVELAAIADPTLLERTIANTFRLRDVPGQSDLQTVIDHLEDLNALIVLDNFEHIVTAAPVVTSILAACPGCKILTSSRVRLRLRGEHDFPVAVLDLPKPDDPIVVESLSRFDSVRLFIERAREAKPAFQVTNENAPAVAEICARLEGLPLAIELAASRIRMMPPEALLKRLAARLMTLTGGARDLPVRQQTLRGAIHWSYDLLTPEDQVLFRQLSIFSNGCTYEAIEAVIGSDTGDWFDGLERLIDHSLVRQSEQSGDARFQMLETVREFGQEVLATQDETRDVASRHATYCASEADQYTTLFGTAGYDDWIRKIDREHDNMRSALTWSLANDEALAFRILHAMAAFWQYEGHINEAISWHNTAIATVLDDGRRARLLANAALLVQMTGDFALAGNHADAALVIFRESGNRHGVVSMSQLVGHAEHLNGRIQRSRELLAESVTEARQLDNQYELCEALNTFGFILYLQEDHKRARPLLEEAVNLARAAEMDEGLSNILHSLGEVCRADHDIAGAANAYREGLIAERKLTYRFGTIQLMGGVAILAAEQGQSTASVRLFAAEESHRTAMGFGLDPGVLDEYERAKTLNRAAIDNAACDLHEAAGRDLSFDEAVQEAIAIVDVIIGEL